MPCIPANLLVMLLSCMLSGITILNVYDFKSWMLTVYLSQVSYTLRQRRTPIHLAGSASWSVSPTKIFEKFQRRTITAWISPTTCNHHVNFSDDVQSPYKFWKFLIDVQSLCEFLRQRVTTTWISSTTCGWKQRSKLTNCTCLRERNSLSIPYS